MRVAETKEMVYAENDIVNSVYFLKSGSCELVLPRYAYTPFVKIVAHTQFGLIDIIAALKSKSMNPSHIDTCGIMGAFEK